MKHIEETNCHLLHSVWWIFWHGDQFAQDKKKRAEITLWGVPETLGQPITQMPSIPVALLRHKPWGWPFWMGMDFSPMVFPSFPPKDGIKGDEKGQASWLTGGRPVTRSDQQCHYTLSAKSHCRTKSVEIDTHILTAFMACKRYISQHDCGQQVSRRWDICGWHTSLTAIRSTLIIIICSTTELWIALIQVQLPCLTLESVPKETIKIKSLYIRVKDALCPVLLQASMSHLPLNKGNAI